MDSRRRSPPETPRSSGSEGSPTRVSATLASPRRRSVASATRSGSSPRRVSAAQSVRVSRTVKSGKRASSWPTTAQRRRAPAGSPSTRTAPESSAGTRDRSVPASAWISDVFPLPLGPIKAVVCAAAARPETASRMTLRGPRRGRSTNVMRSYSSDDEAIVSCVLAIASDDDAVVSCMLALASTSCMPKAAQRWGAFLLSHATRAARTAIQYRFVEVHRPTKIDAQP